MGAFYKWLLIIIIIIIITIINEGHTIIPDSMSFQGVQQLQHHEPTSLSMLQNLA